MRILVASSTFLKDDKDQAPAFVKSQIEAMKRHDKNLSFTVLAPDNSYYYSTTKPNKAYKEIRYHYFWPHRFERLTGRGIVPALRSNKLLYLQVPFLFFFGFWALLRTTHKQKPDIIYAHWFTPQALQAAIVSKLTKTPFGFTTHASDVMVLKSVPGSRKLVRWVCRKARFITSVSGRTTDRLSCFFSDEDWRWVDKKLSQLPMGVERFESQIKTGKVNALMQQIGIEENDFVIFSLGRLVDIKGLNYLIDAFNELEAEQYDLKLVIAGDGTERERLEKQAAESKWPKRIIFAGYVSGDSRKALLKRHDVFVQSSIVDAAGHSEGMPVAIMEAMANGKIVVATNVTGGEEIIDSSIGRVVEQKSAQSLARALQEILSVNERQKASMRRNALSKAKDFSWDHLAKEYIAILKGA